MKEHEQYNAAILEVGDITSQMGPVQIIDRSFLPNFIFGNNDLVIVVGQDGLVANTLKYLSLQLLIGVNPDPNRWDGILVPFTVNDLMKIIPEVLKNKRPIKEITIAKANLNDGQVLYAVNDLFIGQKTHVSARYQIRIGSNQEQQSSSGIIVSTGLGSTGWFKSILTGAVNIANIASKQNLKIQADKHFSWNSDYLYFSVREPFLSKISGATIVFGKINKDKPLNILSQMPENGVIFSDGIESDYVEFRSGVEATITVAEKKGKMVT